MVAEQLIEDLLSFSRLLRPLRGSGMTPQQYWLLRQLRDAGPLSTSELAQALGVTPGSATVACKRLEKAGLVTRTRGQEDERVVLVALTEQGCAQIDALRRQRREALGSWLSVLAPREQEELQCLIERLLREARGMGGASKYDGDH